MTGRDRIVNRSLNPLLATLPEQFASFRPSQVKAITDILAAYDRGADVVILDAPTGTGKTLIGETVRRMMKVRGLYLCSSKSLQEQFVADFKYAKLVMGKSNYATEKFPNQFGSISCDDCQITSRSSVCSFCWSKESCPYRVAKRQAWKSDLAVLNTSFFLAEANNVGWFGKESKRGLVIADECDMLESALMGYVEVFVSARRMSRYGWTAPKLTVEDDWLRWCKEALVDLAMRKVGLDESETDQRKELDFIGKLEANLQRVADDISAGTSSWVYTGDREKVAFKPARVNNYGKPLLWDHAPKWLLMSATVVSSDEMMFSLGGRGMKYETVKLDSVFPVKNRLIRVKGVADMGRRNEGADNEKLMDAIRSILGKTNGKRTLIHSVSYWLSQTIYNDLREHGIAATTYNKSGERERALNEYRATPGSVLVAPSLDRGIDLSDDECRCQIIAKVPFPYLGDKQIASRFYSGAEGKVWYSVQTVRTIVQMTGRGVRSADDWCETWILDSQFSSRLWSGSRELFPKWWRDAVVWEK